MPFEDSDLAPGTHSERSTDEADGEDWIALGNLHRLDVMIDRLEAMVQEGLVTLSRG
jgi:hypothetical protein